MSWRARLSNNMQELRFIMCTTSPNSGGVRYPTTRPTTLAHLAPPPAIGINLRCCVGLSCTATMLS